MHLTDARPAIVLAFFASIGSSAVNGGTTIPAPGSTTSDGFTVSAQWHVHYRYKSLAHTRYMKSEAGFLHLKPTQDITSTTTAEVDVTEEVNKNTGSSRIVLQSGEWHWKGHDTQPDKGHPGTLSADGGFGKSPLIRHWFDENTHRTMVSFSVSPVDPANIEELRTAQWWGGNTIGTLGCSSEYNPNYFVFRDPKGRAGPGLAGGTAGNWSSELIITRSVQKLEAEIKEGEDFSSWVPTLNGAASFQVRMIQPPDLPVQWKISLYNTSNLPGVCNNADLDDSPRLAAQWENRIKKDSYDLIFDFRHYGKTDLNFKPVENPWQVLETTKPLVGFGFAVSCLDYGAHGRVMAVGHVSGQPVVAVDKRKGQPFIRIPFSKMDNDKYRIAAAAKPQDSAETYDQLSRGAAATSDEDAFPAGLDICKGDGLTLFEEYRGFLVRANFEPNAAIVHRRLYPDVKDFFVFMDPDSALLFSRYLEDFQKASGLKVHRIGDDTLTKFINVNDRVVNFNRGDIGAKQHAVQVIDAVLDDATGGLCFPHLGPPGNVSMVFIDSTKVNGGNFFAQSAANYRSINDANKMWLKRVTIHELGHSVAIPHHGKSDDFYKRPIIAEEGGQRSGAFDCAMRYVGADFFIHDVSMDEPDPVNHPYDNKHEQIGLNFCDSPRGTGLNDRAHKRWQCGDAFAGACKTRIIVTDHCFTSEDLTPKPGSGADQFTAPPVDSPERSAKNTQGEAKVAVRLDANGRQQRNLVPGEAIVFDLRLTGLPDAALTLGQPNESWTKQITFKILGPNGTMVPWKAGVRAIGSPVEQAETPAQGGSPTPDKAAPNAIKIVPEARYHAAFALDGNEAAKIGPGELRIFAALNNGTLLSNSVQLKIPRPEELSAQDQGTADSVRTLSQARVAYADDTFDEAERLAREAIAKRADFFEAHLVLARTLRKQNKLREAYDEYGVALQTWKPRPGPEPEPPEEIWFALQSLGEQLHINLQPPPPPRPFVAHSLFAETKDGKANEPFPSHPDRLVFECEVAHATNDPLGVRWIATNTAGIAPPNQLIATTTSKPAETKSRFALKTPTAGFPPGEYRLEVWQAGKMVYREKFEIKAD